MAETSASLYGSTMCTLTKIVKHHLGECKAGLLRTGDLARALAAWATIMGVDVTTKYEVIGKAKRKLVTLIFTVQGTDLVFSHTFTKGLAGHFAELLVFFCPRVFRPKEVRAPMSVYPNCSDWWHLFYCYYTLRDSSIFDLRFRSLDVENFSLAIDRWLKVRACAPSQTPTFTSRLWANATWDNLRGLYKAPLEPTDSCSSSDFSGSDAFLCAQDQREDEASEARRS